MTRRAITIPMTMIGLKPTVDFLCSCALARALAETVKVEWKTYNDSTALNVMYALLPWKEKPGYAEFSMSSRKQVEERYSRLAEIVTMNWLATLPKGPRDMADYMSKLERMRARDRENIQAAARDVQQINKEVVADLNTTMRVLEGIKLVSTIAVAGIGAGAALAGGVALGGISLGASAGWFGAVNTGYSIATSLAKTWDDVPKAKVVGVSKELGKWGGGQAGEALGNRIIAKGAEKIGLQEKLLGEASRKIDQYGRIAENTISQRLAGHARAKGYTAAASQRTAREGLEAAQTEGAKRAVVGGAVKTATVVVFAAWDIIDGLCDFKETWDDTR
ncbi:MAG TPA: hypothetical protein PLF84_00560 [Bryobacteraceae bacterium]|nr:hypothetical protein [Bryobacteraceae bacterium]